MINKTIFCADFGERLKLEREKLGFTQADFASQIGINRMTQASYESGKRSPDAVYLAMARGFGVDVGFVLFNLRQGNAELFTESLERLVFQLCEGLRIPAEKAEESINDLRAAAGSANNFTQLSEAVRVLVGRLLRVSATINASVKVLELDHDMLTDIIAGIEQQATDQPVSTSQKALKISRLYQIFSEKGEIDPELLSAAAKSLSRNV